MIGNDLVDLNLAQTQSNWQRKGWLDKVFCREEQEMISSSNQSNEMVWRLWSMKESAYKCQVQQGIAKRFNPQHFHCRLKNDSHGTVVSEFGSFSLLTRSTSEFIQSTATLFEAPPFFSKIERVVFESQEKTSEEIKTRVLEYFSKMKGYASEHLNIKKNAHQVPKIYVRDEELPFHISLSHHGKFGGYAILG